MEKIIEQRCPFFLYYFLHPVASSANSMDDLASASAAGSGVKTTIQVFDAETTRYHHYSSYTYMRVNEATHDLDMFLSSLCWLVFICFIEFGCNEGILWSRSRSMHRCSRPSSSSRRARWLSIRPSPCHPVSLPSSQVRQITYDLGY